MSAAPSLATVRDIGQTCCGHCWSEGRGVTAVGEEGIRLWGRVTTTSIVLDRVYCQAFGEVTGKGTNGDLYCQAMWSAIEDGENRGRERREGRVTITCIVKWG